MPAAFKTVAVVGKSDAASLPDVLEQLGGRCCGRGAVRILMDPAHRRRRRARRPMRQWRSRKSLPAKADLAIVRRRRRHPHLLRAPHGRARRAARGRQPGRLGFLTDIPADSAGAAIEAILDGDFIPEQRAAARRHRAPRQARRSCSALAMNDVVVSRGAMGSMIEFAVTVDGEFIYSLRADGLIVATPTGSTAYALSAGGPILHPALQAIALVPISPHTLSNRPVAIRSSSKVEITLVRGAEARANFDVQGHWDLEPGDVVSVSGRAQARHAAASAAATATSRCCARSCAGTNALLRRKRRSPPMQRRSPPIQASSDRVSRTCSRNSCTDWFLSAGIGVASAEIGASKDFRPHYSQC